MLDTVLKWLGAGDAAIATMGPVLTIALAWLGGYAATQAFKFPLTRAFDHAGTAWSDWTIRTFAVAVTWGFAHWLSDSVAGVLEVVAAFTQPIAYKVALAAAAKWAPWIEATRFGSAAPSDVAVAAREARRAPPAG